MVGHFCFSKEVWFCARKQGKLDFISFVTPLDSGLKCLQTALPGEQSLLPGAALHSSGSGGEMILADSSLTVLCRSLLLDQLPQLQGSLQMSPEMWNSRQECQKNGGSIFRKCLRICLEHELCTCLSLFSSSSWHDIEAVCMKWVQSLRSPALLRDRACGQCWPLGFMWSEHGSVGTVRLPWLCAMPGRAGSTRLWPAPTLLQPALCLTVP